MHKDAVRQFIPLIGTKIDTISSAGWVNCRCPLAPWTHDSGKDSSPSFAVQIKPNGRSRFYCFTCEHGDLLYLLQRLKQLGAQAPKYQIGKAMQLVMAEDDDDVATVIKDYDDPAQVEEDDGNNLAEYPEQWLAMLRCATEVPLAREYLWARGLTSDTIRELDIRFDLKRETVCFPIRDFDGVLRGLRGRYINPDADHPYHMYKNPLNHHSRLVWYGEQWVNWNRPVLMVESVFDLAAVFPIYPNVVAPLTVGMSARKVKRMSSALDLITLFDMGKGGDKARALIDKHLPDSIKTHLLPCGPHRTTPGKPAKDPGEMVRLQLIALLQSHVPIEVDP